MNERKITAGTQILFGSPAKPIGKVMVDEIRQVINQTEGIHEAYLPQCYILGDEEASQVLVLGLKKSYDVKEVLEESGPKIQMLFGEGRFLDILPFRYGSVPPEAKQVICVEPKEEKEKKWWEIWK
ncbi:enhanced serine sensitivity protein SseB C-terminal domain-containing protein [Pelagicoccus sp. SDUM812003]|uniref:enhanced serine sensitivity protein SseB C-terminal domain-containing protein n=1 Tax=Pelagicoccus sp. SDUM812003 TaxID=3041267 RepID=UPI00280F4A08|nr:enhanced serine sensitivity protein SseB C-terminal domain-containing protein [Pelagicoccus sp. SDUM812003]MDQ8201830.1 enhanced serine sensitivity protein SseB C-terminal domain-containing protein [Pelagicoccus sp. SDUM812003]